jgi:RNA polymerase sigma-32 factor
MQSASRIAVAPLLRKALSNSKMLSAERERELLTRYQADGSKAAMDELVRSHMPIIFRVASRSAHNPGVDINDLIQTATEGLLVAINRWSFAKSDVSAAAPVAAGSDDAGEAGQEPAPTTGQSSRLATYALWWMRIMLTNSVIDNRGVVVRAKNPKVRKALFALPAAIKKLEIRLPLSGIDVARIAAHLGIAEQYIDEALVHAAGDVMLDEPIGDGMTLRGDVTPDGRGEGEAGIVARLTSADTWDAICMALLELTPRDRFILVTRYLLATKWKLDRLSETLKMSRERIRQIACNSLVRIRGGVGPDGAAHNPAHRQAAAVMEALISRIERVSELGDARQMAALLHELQVTTGPLRTAVRPVAAAGSAPPPTRHARLPALAMQDAAD